MDICCLLQPIRGQRGRHGNLQSHFTTTLFILLVGASEPVLGGHKTRTTARQDRVLLFYEESDKYSKKRFYSKFNIDEISAKVKTKVQLINKPGSRSRTTSSVRVFIRVLGQTGEQESRTFGQVLNAQFDSASRTRLVLSHSGRSSSHQQRASTHSTMTLSIQVTG